MDDLQKALTLLKEQLGDFDNIKLLLSGGEEMTREVVHQEFLSVAEQLASGHLLAGLGPSEAKLSDVRVAL